MQLTKSVPQDLLALIQELAPPGADVVPRSWAYEDEDYNIVVVVPDTMERGAAHDLEGRLIDALIDYDDLYKTYTLCMVCRESEIAGGRDGAFKRK